MKTVPAALVSWLQNANAYNKADLYQIALKNGQYIYANSSSMDLVFNGTKYYASQYGAWQRGDIEQEASYRPQSKMVTVTLFAKSTVLYPGTSTSLMATVSGSLFDGAVATIYTVYWGQGETPATGIARGSITSFVGQIANISGTGRSQVTFDVSDMLYILNRPTPPNLVQTQCRHMLGDSNCTINLSSYQVSTTAATGSTTLVLNTAATLSAVPWATLGMVKFTSGQNSGLPYTIKQQLTTTSLQLLTPTSFPVATGDAFIVYPGCDKTLATCQSKFFNSIHFGGQPYVPNPEIAQ